MHSPFRSCLSRFRVENPLMMNMMKNEIVTGCVLLLAVASAVASPQIPGAPQEHTIALVGATVHPVVAPTIDNGVVLFDHGKLVSVGARGDLPEGVEVIDVSGKHVYPGLINAGGQLGLIEINSVRATRDDQETGWLNPSVRAESAVNPDSELIPVTRANGVLVTLTIPQGPAITGKSALLMLDGWTWEEMTLRAPVGLHVVWPSIKPGAGAKKNEEGSDPQLSKISDAFDAATAYRNARRAGAVGETEVDLRWEAMVPVLEGKLPLVIHARSMAQINSAVEFAVNRDLRLIVYGGDDADKCAALLREHDVPVIVQSVYRLPRRRSDAYDDAFTLPERLRQASIKFCIAGVGRFGSANARNLPYHAAMAAAFGLPREEALKAITIYPAQILGAADRVGSLEVGKDATLIVTDGDPLETPTQVVRAYIQGRPVDLNSRHTLLWRKYREKYRRLQQLPMP